jgi:hypothetical protein
MPRCHQLNSPDEGGLARRIAIALGRSVAVAGGTVDVQTSVGVAMPIGRTCRATSSSVTPTPRCTNRSGMAAVDR